MIPLNEVQATLDYYTSRYNNDTFVAFKERIHWFVGSAKVTHMLPDGSNVTESEVSYACNLLTDAALFVSAQQLGLRSNYRNSYFRLIQEYGTVATIEINAHLNNFRS